MNPWKPFDFTGFQDQRLKPGSATSPSTILSWKEQFRFSELLCVYKCLIDNMLEWRRERDSNPRYPFWYSGFQDRRHRPLGHPSAPDPAKCTGTLTPRDIPTDELLAFKLLAFL